MDCHAHRYAIYYAPPTDTPLSAFGTQWLGRNPETGEFVAPPIIKGANPEYLAGITAAPRRYGFHATLKPPFRLAEGATPAALLEALRKYAVSQRAFTVDPPELIEIGGFIALGYPGTPGSLHTLADLCVRDFERFRAEPTLEEITRRQSNASIAGLTPRQAEHLERWGYPYVLDEYRFHMTLTGRLPKAERERVWDILLDLTRELRAAPLVVDAIALFVEPEPGADFRLARQYRFISD